MTRKTKTKETAKIDTAVKIGLYAMYDDRGTKYMVSSQHCKRFEDPDLNWGIFRRTIATEIISPEGQLLKHKYVVMPLKDPSVESKARQEKIRYETSKQTLKTEITNAITRLAALKPFTPAKDYYKGQWDALSWVLEELEKNQ